jgi:hypothetical protein
MGGTRRCWLGLKLVKWQSFITIKKTANGWIRVGTNNFIGLTPAGTSENPTFTVSEASGL